MRSRPAVPKYSDPPPTYETGADDNFEVVRLHTFHRCMLDLNYWVDAWRQTKFKKDLDLVHHVRFSQMIHRYDTRYGSPATCSHCPTSKELNSYAELHIKYIDQPAEVLGVSPSEVNQAVLQYGRNVHEMGTGFQRSKCLATYYTRSTAAKLAHRLAYDRDVLIPAVVLAEFQAPYLKQYEGTEEMWFDTLDGPAVYILSAKLCKRKTSPWLPQWQCSRKTNNFVGAGVEWLLEKSGFWRKGGAAQGK